MYEATSSSMPITRLLNSNSAPVVSESALRDCTKARGSMTETLGMIIPQQAWRFGSQARNPDGVTNDTRVFVFQALTNSRRSADTSRQRPRRISSHEMAMTIPDLRRGMPCSDAYETASALPSRASCPFSDRGCSWIPLWSTPLLRPLVSSATRSCSSITTTRRGLSPRRCVNSLAMAHPTTPAPTMQTSYVFIELDRARSVLDSIVHQRVWRHGRVVSTPCRCSGENPYV